MKIVAILTALLPVICAEYQELRLIRQLTNYFHFDHCIFLLDSATDANRFISTDGLIPQTVSVLREVDNDIYLEIDSKNCLLIVTFETAEFEHIIDRLQLVKAIQIDRKQMKIGMFFPRKCFAEDLLKLFEWCKDNQVTDTFAATYLTHDSEQCASGECLLNVFTFHPFGRTSELVNVTGDDRFDEYFQSTNPNFHREELRYGDSIGVDEVGTLWLTIFELMNATFVVVENNYESKQEAFESGIDVLDSMYALRKPEEFGVYPLQMINYAILVPESLPYSGFSSYLKNGISGKFSIYAILSTITPIVVLVILRYVKRKRILILQSAADVFNLLLNDNGFIKYQKLFRAEGFVIVPLTFIGFIIVNGILSILQSHLTRPVLQPQINTAEDIYRSEIRITAHSSTWKAIIVDLLSSQAKHSDWGERVVVENETPDFLVLYNKTKAVLLGSDVVNVLLSAQKRLNINSGYHKSDTEISMFLFTHMVHRRFLFLERLNDIIQRTKSAGLYQLWLRRKYARHETIVLMHNFQFFQQQGGISVQRVDLQFPMLIVYGWFAGFCVFILEKIWKNCSVLRV